MRPEFLLHVADEQDAVLRRPASEAATSHRHFDCAIRKWEFWRKLENRKFVV